jgi:hypothetical protein
VIPDFMQVRLPISPSQRNAIAASIIVVRAVKRLMNVRNKVNHKSECFALLVCGGGIGPQDFNELIQFHYDAIRFRTISL